MSQQVSPEELVHSFISTELPMADNQLERILVEQAPERNQFDANWKLYFEPWKPSEEELRQPALREECVHLSKAWKDFRETLPEKEQAHFEKRAPNIADVVSTVRQVSSSWDQGRKQGKFGAARQSFHRICAGLNAHSTMLGVLPQGSEYVSLFLGVLNSVLRASANHEATATGIGRSISDITDDVEKCTRMCQLYPTENVQRCVGNLYAHVFLFLRDTMMWYRKRSLRRFLDAFHEDYFCDKFADQISNIKNFVKDVQHWAVMGQAAEQRVVRQIVEQGHTDQRLLAEGQRREIAEVNEMVKQIAQQSAAEEEQKRKLISDTPEKLAILASTIADSVFDLLQNRATAWQGQQSAGAVSHSKESTLLISNQPQLQQEPGREAYLVASRNLEDYFDRDRLGRELESPKVVVTSEISHRLRDFISSADGAVFAIAGSRLLDQHGMGNATKVAINFINHAEEIGLPVISWFCQPPVRGQTYEEAAVEASSLVSLVYALVRQLIELLPLKPRKPIGVSIIDLESLDGTFETIGTAIQLLGALIRQIDFVVFIVIDGLQWLDDIGTMKPLSELIATLTKDVVDGRASSETGQDAQDIRVLLTTTGRSHALLENLEPSTYLLADTGGRNRRGAAGNPHAW